MHNLPMYGLAYEQGIDHVLTLFILLQGGIQYIVRKPDQLFFWDAYEAAFLFSCIQMK